MKNRFSHKLLIDLPETTLVDLERVAIEKRMSRKRYIEFFLIATHDPLNDEARKFRAWINA